MAKLTAKIYYGDDKIVRKIPRKKHLQIRKTDKTLCVNYDGNSEEAWIEIMKRVKQEVVDNKNYGIIIYGQE